MDIQYREDLSSVENYSPGASQISLATTIAVEQGLDPSPNSNTTSARTQSRPTRRKSVVAVGRKTKLKCIALGDSGAHITELLTVFTLGYFPPNHTPTDFKTYVTDVRCDGRDIELALWDLSGQQDYPQLRRASYDKTDVVLICCDSNQSAELIERSVSRWAEELAASCPRAPIILVGITCENIDSRLWSATFTKKNSELKIRIAAERSGGKVMAHVVCDVLSGERVDDVFEMATRAAIKSGGGHLAPRQPTHPTRKSNFAGFFSNFLRVLHILGYSRVAH